VSSGRPPREGEGDEGPSRTRGSTRASHVQARARYRPPKQAWARRHLAGAGEGAGATSRSSDRPTAAQTGGAYRGCAARSATQGRNTGELGRCGGRGEESRRANRWGRAGRRRAPRRARPVPRRPSGASRRARPRAARPHSPRRPAARAPRASRAERAGGESACQCIVELRARRAPRQPAPRTSGRAARHPASAQLAINCRWPASQRPTTLRLCGSGAAQLVARRPICTWWAIHTPAACRPRGTGSR
jgi:hypothetical protein